MPSAVTLHGHLFLLVSHCTRTEAAAKLATSMDAQRWSNILSVERAFRAGSPHPGGGPREAYIEVAARCNLRCIMCPITVDPRYQPGSGWPGLLEPEHFERLEPVFATLHRAHLFGLGEPLLNPHLFDYARRLSRAGVEVWTTTNATLIDDSKAEAMFEAGFDRVSVSIDGATPETYERIRKRGKWEDLLLGLEALGRTRRRHGRPYLVISMVGMVSNLEETSQLVELAHRVGADEVFIEVIYDWPHPDLHEVYRRETVSNLGTERVRELVEAGRRRAGELGVRFTSRIDEWGGEVNRKEAGSEHDPDPLATIGAIPPPSLQGGDGEGAAGETEPDSGLVQIGRTPETPKRELREEELLPLPFPCSEPWQTINVSAAGEVRTCCFNNRIYGRLADADMDDIWYGESYSELRRLHVTRRSPPECNDCVKSWRVKRSPYLRPPEADPELPASSATNGSPEDATARGRLLAPADGDVVTGSHLVVVGTLPPRSRLKRFVGRAEPPVLPEVWLDGSLLARIEDVGTHDGDRFAAVIPVDFVSEGSHRLTLRGPDASESGDGGGAKEGGEIWAVRHIQIGPFDARTGMPQGRDDVPTRAAVSRLAVPVELGYEEHEPQALLNGRKHPLAAWVCGTYGSSWRGVAVVELQDVPPGAHELELCLRHHASPRILFYRLPDPARVPDDPVPSGRSSAHLSEPRHASDPPPHRVPAPS